MSIASELTSGGFLWDRNRPTADWLADTKPPRKRSRSKTPPEYFRAYNARKREKQLRLGIVQPRTPADFAYMAKLRAA